MKKLTQAFTLFYILFSIVCFAQKKPTLYVKLKNSLESSKSLSNRIQEKFSVAFEKQELISKTTNSISSKLFLKYLASNK